MIRGTTKLIAHVGYPTETFKAPMIYNPWFEQQGIDAVVVPMGIKAEDYAAAFHAITRFTNFHGALVTMPHKVATVALLDDVAIAVHVAGACNAVRRGPDGKLVGDMFDGEGFVRGVRRKGFQLDGATCLIVGAGGVGSAIAASLAAAGVATLGVFDMNTASADQLTGRLREHYPRLDARFVPNDPAGYDLVVNATPLGMKPNDPLPVDVARLAPTTFVGEVVMKAEFTPLLEAARAKGCRFQIGTDMLFEQIPAYLDFFGFGSASADELRAVAKIQY